MVFDINIVMQFSGNISRGRRFSFRIHNTDPRHTGHLPIPGLSRCLMSGSSSLNISIIRKAEKGVAAFY